MHYRVLFVLALGLGPTPGTAQSSGPRRGGRDIRERLPAGLGRARGSGAATGPLHISGRQRLRHLRRARLKQTALGPEVLQTVVDWVVRRLTR